MNAHVKPPPSGDTASAVAFLQRWPTPFPTLSALWIDPSTHAKGRFETKSFAAPVDWGAVAAWIDERQGRANLYFGPNALLRPMDKKTERTDIKEVGTLHVDIDARLDESQADARERAVAALRAYSPAPSVIVFSGGGAQGYWFLDAAISIDGDLAKAEDAKLYNVSIERALGGDGCSNVDRIMRLPFTVNLPDAGKVKKGRVPMTAEVVAFDDVRYPLDLFAKARPDVTPGQVAAVAPQEVDWSNLTRINSVDDLDQWKVANWAKLNVVHGDDILHLHECHKEIGHRESEGPYAGKRSDALFAALREFARCGVPTDVALGIITDKRFGISASVFEKKDRRRYARKQVNDAYGKVAAEHARKAGAMAWKETHDRFGLFPKPSYRNARIAIQSMGVVCRFDDFHKKILVGYEGDAPHDISPLIGEVSDAALARLRLLITERFDFDPGEKHVYDAVISLAYENVFDPILDYLDEVQGQWDGTPRLDTAAIKYFGAPDTPLNRAFMKTMLLAAVRRARRPGCKFDQICVLEGVEGTNKSSAIQLLAGGPENFSDATILGVDDQQVQENVAGVWLYEIADLSGISRAEVERVKAFASRDTDRARKAYGRVRENVPRRCVFFASTNDSDYLKSKTGNRRFWPLPTSIIDIDALRRDRDQLWAEAASREAAGESIMLDESLWADAHEVQEQRVEVDLWEDILDGAQGAARVAEVAAGQQRVASADLLEKVIGLDKGKWTTEHGRRLARAMKRLGWKRNKTECVWLGGRRARGFYREEVRDAVPF